MAKWTLPEGKLYTKSELDAAVAAALREAADVAWRFYARGRVTKPSRIKALIPDAGAALDRALAAQREALLDMELLKGVTPRSEATMMQIDITTNYDSHDCETCGYNYAQGGSVKIDGRLVLDIPAHAHCYGGDNYLEDELLVMALHKVGVKVFVDGEKYHVCCQNEDYHGSDEALAAEREAGKREMLDLYERVEKEGGCGETAMRMSIRAQGDKT